jgi:non-homologous end joining protein Ku
VYALLRKMFESTSKVALAHVVLNTHQHLATLMTLDSLLVLVMLRWPQDMRDTFEDKPTELIERKARAEEKSHQPTEIAARRTREIEHGIGHIHQ